MPIFAVRYAYADKPEELDRVRPAHRAFLGRLLDEGVVLASGPFGPDGPAGALILVEAEDPEHVARVFDGDPFRPAGLIEERHIRAWNPTLDRVGLTRPAAG